MLGHSQTSCCCQLTRSRGTQHSVVDAVAFPSYPRYARLERDLVGQESVWIAVRQFITTRGVCGLALSSEKLGQRTAKRNVAKQFSELRCAVSEPLMMSKWIWLSKEMSPQTLTSG
ncbi:hypothetical protein TNCV_4314731 [Trichonephila clavipes]|nr:hypothetical protein TNCV_4314731 [Trichonephila clavipes]